MNTDHPAYVSDRITLPELAFYAAVLLASIAAWYAWPMGVAPA